MANVTANRGPQLMAIDYTFVILAFITIVLRFGVRVFLVRSFGLDDWLMGLAAITFTLYCSFSITGVHYGTGQHEAELPAENVSTARMFWWICYLMYAMTMILSKVSIGCLLLRVAARRLHTWIIYGAMAITVVTCLVFFFVTIFQCAPISFFWNKNQDGTCVSMDVIIGLAYLYSVCSVFTDFTFALLPAWIISGLQLNMRTKLALIPLMAMGCVASAAVVVRFAYLPRFRDPDFLWATTDIAIWSTVEEGLAIAAGSLATLRPLLKLVGYKLGLTSGRPSHMGASSYGKMGSMADKLTSRRRGSQSAGGVLTLKSVRGDDDTPESSGKPPASYDVRVLGRSKKESADTISLSNVIAHSKTYEVTEEYIGHPSTPEDQPWPEKGRPGSTESTRRLRSEFSADPIYGQRTSPV
ncbi:hypothetical protein BKA67DRAFT_535020 [Truncatella angustata]|uniref:Rhodopsin domain-containing protein n=1 Tax=Truncatella angustata TaxID=152316 RepID=A0A9P8UQ91_9PEZI|nr:uncharacterized protein BKA67DRAFT_535020 [Truncatella angustata]KAH6656126.1 hypothetical protein BKA67DRAFT_535020 [Truncatella angustata]KAH8202402.1 hypothetical protein TruAng_003475 [Truncatella angustata]